MKVNVRFADTEDMKLKVIYKCVMELEHIPRAGDDFMATALYPKLQELVPEIQSPHCIVESSGIDACDTEFGNAFINVCIHRKTRELPAFRRSILKREGWLKQDKKPA